MILSTLETAFFPFRGRPRIRFLKIAGSCEPGSEGKPETRLYTQPGKYKDTDYRYEKHENMQSKTDKTKS
jgi:hypothetical protein